MAGEEARRSRVPVYLILRGGQIDGDRRRAGRRENDDGGRPARTTAIVIGAARDVADRDLWVERRDVTIEAAAERGWATMGGRK